MPSIFILGSTVTDVSWEQARAAVRSDLWRASSTALPDDVIDRALHAALRRIEAERRWSWLANIGGTITMQADGAMLDEPAGMKSIIALAYLGTGNSFCILTLSDLSLVRERASCSGIGQPQHYACRGGKIWIDCNVRAGEDFDITFKAGTPNDLALAIANPPLTLGRETAMVIADACRHIALTRLKNESEANRHEAAYQFRLSTLIDEEDEAASDQFGGGIMPDTSYHSSTTGRRYA